MTARRRCGVPLGVMGLLLAAATARAVEPSASLAHTPQAFSLPFEPVVVRSARDSVALDAWWIPGPRRAPVIVLADASKGNRADLLPVARAFYDRGCAVLLFDYRDFGPQGPGAADSLRDVVLASRWIDDAQGALRYARAHADSGGCVFGWGHELGGAVMLAAAARDRGAVDAIVIDNPFRSTDEVMRWNGTSVIPDAVSRQRRLLSNSDEPFVAAGRLRVPVLLMLAGKDEVAPPTVAEEIFRAPRVRVERWLVPAATRAELLKAPGYLDRVMQWIQSTTRWIGAR